MGFKKLRATSVIIRDPGIIPYYTQPSGIGLIVRFLGPVIQYWQGTVAGDYHNYMGSAWTF